ncbi:MAG: DUF4386 domain-containing protein [Leptospiraceae bacterium]|nr:DUF4386 domain-containing protein [Leptospiraceae bacterium]
MLPARKAAKLIGLFFILAFFFYGIGNYLVENVVYASGFNLNSPKYKDQILNGSFLMLLNSLCVAGIGILAYPILNKYNNSIANTYFITRIIEAIFLTLGIISLFLMSYSTEFFNLNLSLEILSILPKIFYKFNYYSYNIAMFFLGAGSLSFCYLLFSNKLIPGFLSIWGLIGYLIFSIGCVLEIYGFEVGTTFAIPGGLFELVFGFWLIFKGFNIKE